MHRCEECDREFAQYETPGKCPLCGVWSKVRCEECGYAGAASFFLEQNSRCPRCGTKARVPGAIGTRWLLAALVGVVISLLIVLAVMAKGCVDTLPRLERDGQSQSASTLVSQR